METTWTYHVDVRREEDGFFHAYAPDAPEAIASGPTREVALAEMRGALTAAVRGTMRLGLSLHPPQARPKESSELVRLSAELAAKAAVYAAWKASGLSKVALAERMERTETEVRRILDPDYGTKLGQLAEAAHALGLELEVATRRAA